MLLFVCDIFFVEQLIELHGACRERTFEFSWAPTKKEARNKTRLVVVESEPQVDAAVTHEYSATALARLFCLAFASNQHQIKSAISSRRFSNRNSFRSLLPRSRALQILLLFVFDTFYCLVRSSKPVLCAQTNNKSEPERGDERNLPERSRVNFRFQLCSITDDTLSETAVRRT